MAATYIGTVAIFGVDGTLEVTAVLTAADFKMTGAEMTDNFDLHEHKDGEGHTQGASAAAREQAATFTIIPFSTTDAGSSGSGEDEPGTEMTEVRENIKLPSPLATVVIAGFGAGGGDAVAPFRGNWAYVGGQINHAPGGLVTLTLNCERYNDDPATQTLFGA